jgi:exopolysaccharide biosynthesis polyprenyl glycosylphosphotransferase
VANASRNPELGLVPDGPIPLRPNVGFPQRPVGGRRGWLVHRALVVADLAGLIVAFVAAEVALGGIENGKVRSDVLQLAVLFVVTLPVWILAIRAYGLYDRDEEQTNHTTVDDLSGVFHLVTVSVWVLFAGAWLSGITTPNLNKTILFWFLAITAIVVFRGISRSVVRRLPGYVQNTIVFGGGDIGQLVARKYLQHPEYGIRLVAVVDDSPRERRQELEGIELWPTDELPRLVRDLQVDRVVFAFSATPDNDALALIHRLRTANIQIDIVPRLFEAVSPNVTMHSVEGLALMGLPPTRLSRSSLAVKRALDLVVASVILVLLAPLMLFISWRIRRGSNGPAFFRQVRLGQDMREFTTLKFRTMAVGDNDAAHREYVRSIMSPTATATGSGLYKIDRPEVTPIGRWLRRTSLDELPQLINVLRGDMSLVGPRPCIPYEIEYFKPHHFERFSVPAGLTGLWQVTARARSTFVEALDMDVAYARAWSFKLDLWILARTPIQVFRQRGAA